MTRPSPELLRALINYVPDTGELFWRVRTSEQFNAPTDAARRGQAKRWNAIHSGQPALNYIDGRGYLSGSVGSVKVLAHRAAWAIFFGEYPAEQIDHINGDKSDNRLVNLRDASATANLRNRSLLSNNTSGQVGVRFDKGAWNARIGVGGKHVYLGRFQSFEEAVAARIKAQTEEGYSQRHGLC